MSKIIEQLSSKFIGRKADIESWFDEQYKKTRPLFYTSVDIRHSGHKIAPVDTNLFPAGFNLLSERARENAKKSIGDYFRENYPDAKKVLLIPENHTRNLYYLENVVTLKEILEGSGLEIKIGGLQVAEPIALSSQSGKNLVINPVSEKNGLVESAGFIPDVIVINNDLSSGAPEVLANAKQPITPPIELGWYKRKKTSHFDTYGEIARNFAKSFGFDEWLISTIFEKCGKVDFKEKHGLECVSINIEKVLSRIRNKYAEYGIPEEPYVFIKADSGTYGMGIMTVRSGQEILDINKKDRNKMNTIKEGVTNTEVIIQEGVPTVDMVDGKVAEPLFYLINGKPVGCTFRVNENRDAFSNLNSQGMTFKNACGSDAEKPDSKGDVCPVQGTISRLASLAASFECYEPKWDI